MGYEVKRLLVSALRGLEQEALQTKESAAAGKQPKSRFGKKAIAGHFAPEVAWQFKKLALDRQTTVQALLEEALEDLFEKHHLPSRELRLSRE